MGFELEYKFNYFCVYFYSNVMKKNRNILFFALVLTALVIGFYVSKSSKSSLGNEIAGASSKVKTSLQGLGCLINKNNQTKEHVFSFSKQLNANNQNSKGLLSQYSLEEFLPEIGDQGNVGSCVGWATAYYGLTIVKRMEKGKDYPEFSPLSVFNRYCHLKGFDPCRDGSYIDGCLSLLVTKGCPFVKDYDKPNCSVDANTKRYTDCLFSFERLQHNNVNQLKLSLVNNCPVVIGLEVFQGGLGNTLNSKFLDSNGVAKMDLFRNSKYPVGGHALCVVGYDDNVGGGAFKIANSWGKSWGKSGFFWLRYKDLDMVRCAFSLFTNSVLDKNTANNKLKTRVLSINNTTSANLYLSLGYDTPQGIQTKGWFRIEAGLSRNIDVSQRSTNGVYYILMDEDGNVLEGKNKAKSLPLKKISFDLNANGEVSEGSENHQYASFFPSNKKQVQSLSILAKDGFFLGE
jgi:hypothetical protein